MTDLYTFKEHLDAFCNRFIDSDLKKELKKRDHALYECPKLNQLNQQKMEIENELSHLVDLEPSKRGAREEDLLKAYKELRKEIDSLPEVKSYLEAYNKVKEIKDIFNDKIFGEIA